MNMNELKMNWTGSAWTLNGEEDTGLYTVRNMTMLTNLVFALGMGGYIVSEVVLGDTSIALLGMKYAPTEVQTQRTATLNVLENSRTYGSSSNQSNTTSRESQQPSFESLDGKSGQMTTSAFPLERLSPTSTKIEAKSSFTKSDTMKETEDSHSPEGCNLAAMGLNAWAKRDVISALLKEAEIQLSSECVVSRHFQFRLQVQDESSDEWKNIVAGMV